MDFQFSEEQQMLAASVRRLIDTHYDFEARKAVIASVDGWSDGMHTRLSELGLSALPFPEDHGGFAAGALDMIPVMQELGRGLLLEPLTTTLGAAGRILSSPAAMRASPALVAEILREVTCGHTRLAFAHAEAEARWATAHVETRATRHSDGHWHLHGKKSVVLHAPCAQWIVLSARTAGESRDKEGLSVFLLRSSTPGLRAMTYRTFDDQRAADLAVDVVLGEEALIGEAGKAYPVIEEAIDWAQALHCAEMLGVMDEANRLTLEYLKTRRQFGVPIGAFQALQHRMVDMMISAEQSRSITYLACDRVDAARAGTRSAAERRRSVSMARVKLCEAARHIGQEAVQLHGGMGMTIEMKISHCFKRLTALSQLHGDVDVHLERLAQLH
jgi:alkylation response protein AidB-like acyl-CoA dehydrogenase